MVSGKSMKTIRIFAINHLSIVQSNGTGSNIAIIASYPGIIGIFITTAIVIINTSTTSIVS